MTWGLASRFHLGPVALFSQRVGALSLLKREGAGDIRAFDMAEATFSKSPGPMWVPRVPADLVRNPASYCFPAAPEVSSC